MATIRFKRGSTDPVVGIGPTGLTAGEPAFNSTDNKFFIHNGTTAIWVGAEIENTNANWSDGTVVPTKNAVNLLVSGAISGGGNLVNSVNAATGDVTISDSGPGLLVDTTNKTIAITNTGVTGLTLSAATNKGLSISGDGTTGELTKSISLDFANAPALVGATLADKFFVGDASNSDAISYITIGTALNMISGDITVNSGTGVAAIGSGVIVDADINASAAIVDTKLDTIATANKVSLTALNIDSGTDIGADLADADLIIVDDGAGGTNVKSAVSRIPTYVFSKVSGDITIASNGAAAIGSGVIVNADIDASAAIATSKLAANTISGVALGSNLNALTIGSGLGGAASYNGSSEVTITNEGVRSLAGTANEIEVSGTTGDITIGLPDNVTVGGNLSVVGNFTVNGTTTTVNSTTVAIQDPIFTLGGTAALSSDDNKDRGIEFRWHNGTTAKTGFFGFNDDVQRFTFIPDATNSSEVFSGTGGDVEIASVYFANNGNLGQIVPTTLTGTRTYTLPDETGTIITSGVSTGIIPILGLDIDGGTDIGADLADADLIIVDDGAGGTNRKSAVSRIPTYVFSKVSGDITIASDGVAAIGSGVIVNADIDASAAIVDTKLGTIATANKVSLSAINLDGGTETTSIVGTDLLFVDDGADGTNRKVTVDNLFGSNSTAIIDGGSY